MFLLAWLLVQGIVEGQPNTFDPVTSWLGADFVPMTSSTVPDHYVNEATLVYFALHISRGTPAGEILAEIKRELPTTGWGLTQIRHLREGIKKAARVPKWFHETLAGFNEETNGPLKIDNPILVKTLEDANKLHSSSFSSRDLLLFTATNWIDRCVYPLKLEPMHHIVTCAQREDGDWELTKDSFSWFMMDLGLAQYEQLSPSEFL